MSATAPKPGLIESLTLALPRLSAFAHHQALSGLRLLHITDLHIRKPSQRMGKLLAELGSERFAGCDLLLLTGDAMHGRGHEAAAMDYLAQLVQAAKPRYGAFGCFGNHDSPDFQRQARDLPITWLDDAAHRLPDLPINLLGLSCSRARIHGDLMATLLSEGYDPAEPPRLRMLLSHLPMWLTPASEVGIDLVFSGHTHGGQCRLPGRRALYNACDDWPLHLSTGIVQQGRTLGVIARGLGESNIQGLRFLCKPHAPLITLQLPDADPAANDIQPRQPTLVVPW